MAIQSVADIYQYILSFVDLDQTDVPQALCNAWIQEAYDDLIGQDVRWPWLEIGGQDTSNNYSIETVNLQQNYALPTVNDQNNGVACVVDPKKIIAVQGPRWELTYHAQYGLEKEFPPTFLVSREPEFWSFWGEKGITLWPSPNGVYQINLRAYREPCDFVSIGGLVDGPADFGTCLQQYVLSNCWSQQSDLQQAAYWMQNYLAAKDRLRKRYIRGPLPENLVMNRGRLIRSSPRLLYPFEGLGSGSENS